MNHARLCAQLSAFVDGALPPLEHGRVAEHLNECATCREEANELRRTVALLRRLAEPEEPPVGLAERVAERVRERERTWWRRGWSPVARFLDGPWGAPVATAAAASAVVLVLQATRVEPVQVAALGTPVAARAPGPEPAPRVPLAARRGTELPGLRGGPLPVLCLEQPSARGCDALHAYMVGLAMDDAARFASELEGVPLLARERWLGELSRYAALAGSAPLVAQRLRASGDPRAARLATRFEFVAAEPR
jgi:hypothetical protein